MRPIPGLFPPATPTLPLALDANPYGGFRAVFWRQPASEPRLPVVARIRSMGGSLLWEDPDGLSVFTRVADDNQREYLFITDPNVVVLPRGMSMLEVLIGDSIRVRCYLHTDDIEFQRRKYEDLDQQPSGIALTGNTRLIEGQAIQQILFHRAFNRPPSIVLVSVIADSSADPVLVLTSEIGRVSELSFELLLSEAPNAGNYRLYWAAWV